MSRPVLTLLFAAFAALTATPGSQAPPIRVHVLDRAGAPIARAAVETFEDSRVGRVTTGVDGWCSLELVAERAPSFRMRVEAAGFFHSDSLQSRVTEISVQLLRAAPLTGRVIARDTRQPLAGAVVDFVHPLCGKCAPERVVCDHEGRYAFAAVPVDAQATFFATADGFAKQSFLLGFAGPKPTHELELARGFEVRGKVVDHDSRSPLPKTRVATRGKVEVETTCDDAGAFTLRVLPDAAKGRVNLEAEAEGYCKLRFVVRAELANELELPLFRPAFIEGVASDARGAPLAGAEIAVREDNDWLDQRRANPSAGERIPFDELPVDWFVASGHPNHTVLADASGRFRTQGVVPWSPKVLIQVEHGSLPRFSFDAGPLGAPGSTLTVRVAPPAPPSGPRLRGSVRVNGEAVFGAVEWQGATRSGRVVLDARGDFEALGVELGDVTLRPIKLQTRSVTYGSLFDGELAHVDLTAEHDARHDFALKCELDRLAGRVTTTSGKPCANVAVSASEREHETRGASVTNADGTFVVRLPRVPGPWRVVASWGSELVEKNGIAVGETVAFEVPELGRALARFVDRRTQAVVAPSSIAWRRAGEQRFQLRDLVLDALTDDGRWYPFQIPYGEFELLAWSPRPGYAPVELRKFVLKEGDAPPELEFELEQGLAVDFTLAPESAAPMRDERERVWLLEASPTFFGEAPAPWTKDNVSLPTYADRTRRVTFDALDRARVAGLRVGRHRFVSFSPKLRIEPAEIEISAENQRFAVRIVREP